MPRTFFYSMRNAESSHCLAQVSRDFLVGCWNFLASHSSKTRNPTCIFCIQKHNIRYLLQSILARCSNLRCQTADSSEISDCCAIPHWNILYIGSRFVLFDSTKMGSLMMFNDPCSGHTSSRMQTVAKQGIWLRRIHNPCLGWRTWFHLGEGGQKEHSLAPQGFCLCLCGSD